MTDQKEYWPEQSVLDEKPEVSPNASLKLKRPVYLDEIRKEDPQKAIDYIFRRKEIWKGHAQRLQKEKDKAAADAAEQKEKAKLWKKRYKEESKMKERWRFATISVSIGAGVLAVMMVCMAIILTPDRSPASGEIPVRVPTSGTVQRTPQHVLASVIIYNGDLQGSGTIIAKGPEKATLLTCAHLFKGRIGGNFWVYFADGTYTGATLVAIDKERDLALATVDSGTVLDHSYVPAEMPEGVLTGVGFTNGRGPIFKELAYETQWREASGHYVWRMRVTKGEFSAGDSGGGVFMNNGLIGVTNSRNYCGAQRLYAIPHHEVVAFLKEHQQDGLADWSVAPEPLYGASEDSPPLWRPTPNIPVNVPQLAALPAGQRRPSDVPAPEGPPVPDKPVEAPQPKKPSDVPDKPKAPSQSE